MHNEIQETLRKLAAAVAGQAREPDAFLHIMAGDGVFALGTIDRQLDDDRLQVVDSVVNYFDRWRREGGPHEDERPQDYDPFREFERRANNEPPYRPELADWNAASTLRLRGRLAVLLNVLLEQQVTNKQDDEIPGHWVPARLLVDEDDPAIDHVNKIAPFCEQHQIPKRPGTTKDGKPWPQRCDVHLETWEKKIADLRKERQLLQDAADAQTADKDLLGEWKAGDAAE